MRFLRFLWGWWGAPPRVTPVAHGDVIPIQGFYSTTIPVDGRYGDVMPIRGTYETSMPISGVLQ